MSSLLPFLQVLVIDLVLAGDNALVIAAAASGLPSAQRRPALVFGVALAIITRLFFSLCAAWLLAVPFLGVIGGALLLWIAWKLFHDACNGICEPAASIAQNTGLWMAIGTIVTADLSMSLDNILGVGAAAQGHPVVLCIGLVISMCLMGTAANWIAGQMNRRPWLIFFGVAAIAAAGGRMIVMGL
jgi:YjbE family integral membrane protein